MAGAADEALAPLDAGGGLDEDAEPENDAEAAIMDERMAREDQTTSPHTTLDRDDPPPTDV